jgi:hypothetical protein
MERRVNEPFCLSFNGKLLNAFVMVNRANHVILVAVCYYLFINLI